MPQKENKNFTGFIAYYEDGRAIKEKENFFSKKLKKQCATSWAEINKKKLKTMTLYWKGQLKASIERDPQDKGAPYTHLNPDQWFFSQSGYLDLSTRKVAVVSRNIGYILNGIIHITSVNEQNGIVRIHSRGV